ncbi:MAG: hypothetical protein ACK4E8_08055 [Lacibacter sp.]|jgi:anti-sigma factor RsiW
MNEQTQHTNPDNTPWVSEEELLNYLNNRLSAAERQSVEERLAQSELLQDAKEGLELMENKSALPGVVARLNRNLIRQLQQKRRKPRMPLPSQQLLVMVVLLLLLLLSLAFFVILRLKSAT